MRLSRAILAAALAAAGVVGAALGASAQETGATPPLAGLYACAATPDDAARLACFDAAVAGLQGAEAKGEFAAVTRAEVESVEREAFGLSLPSLPRLVGPLFGGGGDDRGEAGLERVTLTVTRVDRDPRGRLLLTMENGQVWAQTDGRSVRTRGDGPWTAEIRKAALGSFFLNLDGQTAFRAERVE